MSNLKYKLIFILNLVLCPITIPQNSENRIASINPILIFTLVNDMTTLTVRGWVYQTNPQELSSLILIQHCTCC